MSPGAVAERLAGLRADFDHSFGEPARRHDEEYVELLAVRAGGRPYALRLSQTSGLFPDRPVTALPGPVPALLGVAGFSGAIVPVYDLAALLGHAVPDRPRWLVLAAGRPALALAFHELDGHVRVPAASIMAEGQAGTAETRAGTAETRVGTAETRAGTAEARAGSSSLRGMVPLPGGTRAIVDLPAARAAVHALTGHTPAADPPAAHPPVGHPLAGHPPGGLPPGGFLPRGQSPSGRRATGSADGQERQS